MILFILLGVCTTIIGISKAISDRVDNTSTWYTSIFSQVDDGGAATNKLNFFGPKDETDIRKHKYKHINKMLHYLFSTILVGATDIWHLGNTIRYIAWSSTCIIGYYLPHESYTIWAIVASIANIRIVFHVFYTYIFYKER